MACRFPGASDPRSFWDNLVRGVEPITGFSDAELLAAGEDPDLLRHPQYVKAAPILAAHDQFDAGFFGYSPREARLMDPQHRLFLEVAWEAFEDAGYDPLGDRGVVGVYAGAGGLVSSYALRVDHPELRGQTGDLGHIGTDRDFLASRVSYKLDLTGPSVNVQSACSTSLVALHLACRGLLNGETDMALAGASVVRVPHVRGYLAEPGNIYSRDGHCRAFDAQASGTLFGSGVAAVVLKRLAAALADGDHVYAVIKGAAVTNDGGRKVAYTASTASAQARAATEAMAIADVAADTIGFVECHGTATALGDPVEIQALTAAFRAGEARVDGCPIGSVKSNLGHLEQCAGMAGLMKAVLALQHGVIPPSLHFETPNPRIRFDRSPFVVATTVRPFERARGPRRAAVNSVGMGGTNAFVVLEEAPATRERARDPQPPLLTLPISAQTPAALATQVSTVRGVLVARDAADARDVCFTLARGRHHFRHRLCAIGRDRDELVADLDRLARAIRTDATDDRPRRAPIVFLFSGQGSQYARMGEALYGTEPAFREALDRCLTVFRAAGMPLDDVLFGEDDGRLRRTLYAQPALFALQVALVELWSRWGVAPATVIGHSVGEFAAAVTAGACSFEDAARLVTARARLMDALPDGGGMLAVAASVETIEAAWPRGVDDIAVAAMNAPDRTTVAGPTAALATLVAALRERGIAVTALNASHAFHSPLMDPVLEPLEALAGTVAFTSPRLRWISTLTGEEMTAAPDARYWRDQVRLPVRFRAAVERAVESGAVCLEVGPGSTLVTLARQCARGAGATVTCLPSMVRDTGEWPSILAAVQQLYVNGVAIRWDALAPTGSGRRLSLPTYPFERRRWWLEARGAGPQLRTPDAQRQERSHPLLGVRLGGDDVRFETLLDLRQHAFLSDHRVFDQVVYPTAAMLETVTAAAARVFGFSRPVIESFVYERALTLLPDRPVWLHLLLDAGATQATFRLETTGLDDADGWQLHASGTVRDESDVDTMPPFPSHALRSECADVTPERFYGFLSRRGLGYGAAFQGIVGLWRQGDEAFAKVRLPADQASEGYDLHPAFLDACLHLYAAVVRKYGAFDADGAPGAGAYVPITIESFHVYRTGATAGWAHATVASRDGADETQVRLDIRVYGDDGGAVALFRGVTIRETAAERFAASGDERLAGLLYRLAWREWVPSAPPAPPVDEWCVFADASGVGQHLAKLLAGEGARVHVLAHDREDAIDPGRADAFLRTAGAGSLGVVYLWALDADTAPGTPAVPPSSLAGGACLDVLRSLDRTRGDVAADTRLWLVTRGAQAADPGDSAPGIAQAPLWGLGRTIALEYPGLWGGLVDLAPTHDVETAAAMLLEVLERAGSETEIVLREDRRLVPRLVRFPRDVVPPPRPVRTDGTHWIVGGMGAVGLETAKALVDAGARHLVLTGRHAGDLEGRALLAELRRLADVVVLSADVANEADVERVLAYVDAHMPPLAGVIHAAAVFDDAVLSNLTRAQLDRVLRPKVTGAWMLSRATAHRSLDYFVLFSSVLSVWGSAGQGAYTAANSFLDALVAFRRAAGLPATVFNWGPWADVGAEERWGPVSAALWKQRATPRLAARTCLDVLLRFLDGEPAQVIVCDTDWRGFAGQFADVPAMFRELVPASHGPAASGTAAGASPESPIDIVRGHVSRVLGVDANVPVTQPLNELGLDSLLAVNLANRLRQALNVPVPTAMLLRGPSIADLVAELLPGARPAGQQEAAPETSTARVAGDGWLIFHRPNPGARVRLFCFPFAGGGAATFRSWAALLHPSIELVAIEPPGRQTRIDEPTIRDLPTFVRRLVPALVPFLDRPFAVYGHCLGALTLFETARTLIREHGRAPMHVFVSGARPPDEIHRHQAFETALTERLLRLPGFNVFEPIHRQPDEVFAEAMLQFNVVATETFLDDPELRRLMLPVIRAEFEMSSRYRHVVEPAWDVPITCLTGIRDTYVSPDNARSWARFTTRRFQLFMVDTEHFLVVDTNQVVIDVLNRELAAPA